MHIGDLAELTVEEIFPTIKKAEVYGAWLGGYMSGVNTWVPGKKDWAGGTDSSGLMAWIDNYCGKNPLDSVGRAALKLFLHLESR